MVEITECKADPKFSESLPLSFAPRYDFLKTDFLETDFLETATIFISEIFITSAVQHKSRTARYLRPERNFQSYSRLHGSRIQQFTIIEGDSATTTNRCPLIDPLFHKEAEPPDALLSKYISGTVKPSRGAEGPGYKIDAKRGRRQKTDDDDGTARGGERS